MPTQKINLLPNLQAILDGCHDPNGGYVVDTRPGAPENSLILKSWDKDHQPQGDISLGTLDYEAYKDLCKKVKYEPKGPVTENGGGGVTIKVLDLVNVIAKVGKDTEAIAEVSVE